MKNNFKIVVIVGLVSALVKAEKPAIQQEQQKRMHDIRLEVDNHYMDIVAYSTGDIDPLNGHFPLDRRLMDWTIKAQQLSDEDKKELVTYVQELDEKLRNGIPGRFSFDTYRAKMRFANGSSRIFCSLGKEICTSLWKIHDGECDKVWADEQARSKLLKK